jgi:hypothetical protein
MTFAEIEQAFAALLPTLMQAAQDAATGEGGLQKIVKLAGDMMGGVQIVQQVISTHPAVVNAAPAP